METTEQSHLVTSSALLSGLTDKLESTYYATNWVRCPACQEEWSKLHPSIVWGSLDGENMKPHTQNICVQCAESTKSFPWIVAVFPHSFDNWPQTEVKLEWPKKQINSIVFKYLDGSGESVPIWKNLMAKLWIWSQKSDLPDAIVQYENRKLVAMVSGIEEQLFSDNSIDLWFKIIQSKTSKK